MGGIARMDYWRGGAMTASAGTTAAIPTVNQYDRETGLVVRWSCLCPACRNRVAPSSSTPTDPV